MGKRQLHHIPEPPKRKKGAQPGNKNGKGGPPGNTKALKNCYYITGFTDQEIEELPHQKIGNVQDELQAARIILKRACTAQLIWERQKGLLNEQVRLSVKAALGSTMAAELFNLETIELKEAVITAEVIAEGEEIPVTLATPTSETKVMRRRTDFSSEILKYMRIIIALEETQLKLMEEGSGEDYARQLADDIRLFGDNAMGTMPGHGLAREEV